MSKNISKFEGFKTSKNERTGSTVYDLPREASAESFGTKAAKEFGLPKGFAIVKATVTKAGSINMTFRPLKEEKKVSRKAKKNENSAMTALQDQLAALTKAVAGMNS